MESWGLIRFSSQPDKLVVYLRLPKKKRGNTFSRMTAEILDLTDGNLNPYSETTTEGEKECRFPSIAISVVQFY